jgi:CDP-6-deoxy-D-xylo-4-hexulose-3-dehydrase
MNKSLSELKTEILRLTREYSRHAHAAQRPGDDVSRPAFIPGETVVPYAGRVFTEDEVEVAVGSTLDFWLTLGPEGEAFEKELAAFLGVKYSLLVNSGSSANLVALSALTTHKLPAHKRIQPGDEVITVAAGFPTTVAPILQLGAVPVFIDNDPATGNIRAEQLGAAFSPGKTKAVMIAHALGNPFDVASVLEFCKKHDLWLVEDNCDALGCTYSMPLERAKKLGLDHLIKLAETNALQVGGESLSSTADSKYSGSIASPDDASTSTLKLELDPSGASSTPNFNSKVPFIRDGILTAYTGTFGDISTQSFYPPHHLTMGEGGAVNIVSRPPLKTYAESFRDWGRDCWCPSGKDDTCGKRFGWNLGELPPGYDHKYTYSHLGYNLKPLDPQAAIGRKQLLKLPAFIEARSRNWEYLRVGLDDLSDVFDFSLPTHATAWLPPSRVEGARLSEKRNAATSTSELQLSTFDWDSSGCTTGCSWFGFMLRVKPSAPFTHTDLARHLDEKKIGNRMFFGGNLLRQPVFVQLRKDRPEAFRVVSSKGKALTASELELQLSTSTAANGAASPLPGADEIMNQAIFLGTYPGLTKEMMDYEIETIRRFVRGF